MRRRPQAPLPPATSLADGGAAPTVCITADLALSSHIAAVRSSSSSRTCTILLHAAAGELRTAFVPHVPPRAQG